MPNTQFYLPNSLRRKRTSDPPLFNNKKLKILAPLEPRTYLLISDYHISDRHEDNHANKFHLQLLGYLHLIHEFTGLWVNVPLCIHDMAIRDTYKSDFEPTKTEVDAFVTWCKQTLPTYAPAVRVSIGLKAEKVMRDHSLPYDLSLPHLSYESISGNLQEALIALLDLVCYICSRLSDSGFTGNDLFAHFFEHTDIARAAQLERIVQAYRSVQDTSFIFEPHQRVLIVGSDFAREEKPIVNEFTLLLRGALVNSVLLELKNGNKHLIPTYVFHCDILLHEPPGWREGVRVHQYLQNVQDHRDWLSRLFKVTRLVGDQLHSVVLSGVEVVNVLRGYSGLSLVRSGGCIGSLVSADFYLMLQCIWHASFAAKRGWFGLRLLQGMMLHLDKITNDTLSLQTLAMHPRLANESLLQISKFLISSPLAEAHDELSVHALWQTTMQFDSPIWEDPRLTKYITLWPEMLHCQNCDTSSSSLHHFARNYDTNGAYSVLCFKNGCGQIACHKCQTTGTSYLKFTRVTKMHSDTGNPVLYICRDCQPFRCARCNFEGISMKAFSMLLNLKTGKMERICVDCAPIKCELCSFSDRGYNLMRRDGDIRICQLCWLIKNDMNACVRCSMPLGNVKIVPVDTGYAHFACKDAPRAHYVRDLSGVTVEDIVRLSHMFAQDAAQQLGGPSRRTFLKFLKSNPHFTLWPEWRYKMRAPQNFPDADDLKGRVEALGWTFDTASVNWEKELWTVPKKRISATKYYKK